MIRLSSVKIGNTVADSSRLLLLGESEDLLIDLLRRDVQNETLPPLHLIYTEGTDWDADFSPWPLETAGRSFAGKANELYRQICAETEASLFLCGYSLAGMAALYFAGLGGERFRGCACCSGSLWYPGFTDWLKAHTPGGKIYLSLGGKEKNTRDSLMASIEERTEEVYRLLKQNGDCCFVHEPGGHFRDPAGRMERGIRWLMQSDMSRNTKGAF